MTITEMDLPIRDLVVAYHEDDTTGRVSAMGGRLDVRPEYQREFVYDEKQQSAVINTVMHQFPLNIMYFVRRPDDTFEVLDGQQRIISICRYITNPAISAKIPAATGGYNMVNFNNLDTAAKDAFLDYQLRVYICEGTDKEKLDWFQVINIAGEVLEQQEIRNALYHGPWLTSAKSAFSRRNCAAHRKYGKYMAGDYIRQKYLETVFSWKAEQEGFSGRDAIVQFMQAHRDDSDANDLWNYYEDVFTWVQKVFGSGFDKSMKGVLWGFLYNAHKDDNLDPALIQAEAERLLADSEVQKKAGIYPYLLTGDEKYLNIRQFDPDVALSVYHAQGGKCALCGQAKDFKDMHADHIQPWSKGGKTVPENCQMLCVQCNLKKSNK